MINPECNGEYPSGTHTENRKDPMDVLVADKDVSVLSHIVDLIRGWGYRAEKSETGQDTLEKIKEKMFRCAEFNISRIRYN